MTRPDFHIAVGGPVGFSFPSFPSSTLEEGDPQKISLAMIRNKCSISNKLFFTFDGKSRIADSTTLAYYMSLSSEGQQILGTTSPETKPKEGDSKTTASSNSEESNKTEQSAAPGVSILTLQVTNENANSSPMPMPQNEALDKLLQGLGDGSLKRGELPTFSNRELASLKESFAAKPSSVVYREPSELTESQWASVLSNNRALHGYYYDWERDTMVKARKAAFKLKGSIILGKPPSNGSSEDAGKDESQENPPLPPFYVDDDAHVSVMEVRKQTQSMYAKEGFNVTAAQGSLGRGVTAVPKTVSGSYEAEHAKIDQRKDTTNVQSLVVTYNFPRVVVELDTDCLSLTAKCKEDAKRVTSMEAQKEFFHDYGTIFSTKFTLGGFLHSTRNVTETEQSTLDQLKDKTRIAAGISIQSPLSSGGLNAGNVNSKVEEKGFASLLQDVCLTWDARGGDTTLCTNPPIWANTVKNHQLWRLMNQQRIVDLLSLIKVIDYATYNQIDSAKEGGSGPPAKREDIMTDKDLNQRARVNLGFALDSGEDNNIAKAVRKCYIDGKFAAPENIKLYNEFYKKYEPKDTDSLIKSGTQWKDLVIEQSVGFGLYMAVLGKVDVL